MRKRMARFFAWLARVSAPRAGLVVLHDFEVENARLITRRLQTYCRVSGALSDPRRIRAQRTMLRELDRLQFWIA